MKKTGLLFALIIMAMAVQSQDIVNTISKNISVGFDVYTDILTKKPEYFDPRAINMGFNAYTTYNFKVGDGPHIFGMGVGIRSQNFYSNTRILNVQADEINFIPINNKLTYKKSKINLVYVDIPGEMRFYLKEDVKVGIGFKVGFLIDSKTKYVGQLVEEGATNYIKEKNINRLEKYTFGPTLRLGFKWFNVFAFYQPSRTFEEGAGPEFSPISVGITLTPF